jgi:hypothetical protein
MDKMVYNSPLTINRSRAFALLQQVLDVFICYRLLGERKEQKYETRKLVAGTMHLVNVSTKESLYLRETDIKTASVQGGNLVIAI